MLACRQFVYLNKMSNQPKKKRRGPYEDACIDENAEELDRFEVHDALDEVQTLRVDKTSNFDLVDDTRSFIVEDVNNVNVSHNHHNIQVYKLYKD